MLHPKIFYSEISSSKASNKHQFQVLTHSNKKQNFHPEKHEFQKKEVEGESEVTWRWSEKSGGCDERKGIERCWIEEEWLKNPLLTPSVYPFPISFLTFHLFICHTSTNILFQKKNMLLQILFYHE